MANKKRKPSPSAPPPRPPLKRVLLIGLSALLLAALLGGDRAGAAEELGKARPLPEAALAGDNARARRPEEKAGALQSDDALSLDYARVLALAGRPEEAFPVVEKVKANHDTRFQIEAD